jgi:glyoxylase-like metal-dependent hydrolase (beta-lactamase superfamily II)
MARFRADRRYPTACAVGALGLLAMVRLAGASSYVTSERSVSKIADGVYVIIHEDAVLAGWPQGNTTIVVGDRDVLVVDACFLPGSALEDIADIRRLTSKPVRYLVDTHFHIDHTAGNSVYMKAFPELEIVSTPETRTFMDARNPHFGADAGSPTGRPATVILPALRNELATGKDEDGNPISGRDLARLPLRIRQEENLIAEYGRFVYQPPTLTFDHLLTLDLGNREVRLMHLGRGHTPGDVLAYLPKEKVMVAGDLLTYPIPYMRMSFPHDWVEVLRAMSRLDADYIVPGHGRVLTDKTHLDDVIALLDSVIRQVHEQAPGVADVGGLHVDIESFRERMAGDDPVDQAFWSRIVDPGMLDGVNQGVVGRAYAEEVGRLSP